MNPETAKERAREIFDKIDGPYISLTKSGEYRVEWISQALLAAFNAGLEEAALIAENTFMNAVVPRHTAVRDFIAAAIRQRKVS